MSLGSMINCHTTPIFVENSHERPFSIIPKANTYGFLTKKWSPPEIQECDLWQGNLCGVRCTSLWSMVNGDTTPIFVENSHEWPFSMTLKANTYEFWPTNGLNEKSKIVIYGKKTYVGWGVRASGRWLMATQPPFLSKIAMNVHFQWHWSLTPTNFWPTNGLHEKSKIVIYDKKKYVGWSVQASSRWSMATQPPFLLKIAMNDHFQWHWRLTPMDIWPRMVSTINPRIWSKANTYGKETYV
jgi:hypothetical protein